jgi:hypothetical protein
MSPALASALDTVAVRRGDRGFTFGDLARPAMEQQATMGQLAAWLADARTMAFIEDLGFDPGTGPTDLGPRRYRITSSGLLRAEIRSSS